MSDENAAGIRPLRLLVPINANADSRWGVAYALKRSSDRPCIEVCLLNVGEPVDQWEVLRFRTQTEIARFQAERAEVFLEEASRPLVAAGVPHRACYRQGPIVFSILDAAEEMACDEIIMPAANDGLGRLFSRNIVRAVRSRARHATLVTVDDSGRPIGTTSDIQAFGTTSAPPQSR